MESQIDTQTGISKKAGTKLSGRLEKIQDVVESQPQLKEGLERVMDMKDEWVEESGKRLTVARTFVTKNWRTIIPAVAAVGLGAFFLAGRSKKVKTMASKLHKKAAARR